MSQYISLLSKTELTCSVYGVNVCESFFEAYSGPKEISWRIWFLSSFATLTPSLIYLFSQRVSDKDFVTHYCPKNSTKRNQLSCSSILFAAQLEVVPVPAVLGARISRSIIQRVSLRLFFALHGAVLFAIDFWELSKQKTRYLVRDLNRFCKRIFVDIVRVSKPFVYSLSQVDTDNQSFKHINYQFH